MTIYVAMDEYYICTGYALHTCMRLESVQISQFARMAFVLQLAGDPTLLSVIDFVTCCIEDLKGSINRKL